MGDIDQPRGFSVPSGEEQRRATDRVLAQRRVQATVFDLDVDRRLREAGRVVGDLARRCNAPGDVVVGECCTALPVMSRDDRLELLAISAEPDELGEPFRAPRSPRDDDDRRTDAT